MSRPASNWRRCNMPSVGHCSSVTKSCWLLRIGDSLTYLGGGVSAQGPAGGPVPLLPAADRPLIQVLAR